uniref:Glycosyl transferase family 25 domain-containing protein n=1 Tax=viral metagenome TaxID=1070528 RepID=A0A6C0IHR0_9ZZZZ
MSVNCIADITNIVYINLDSRSDRRIHIEQQLKLVGLNKYERFKAIKTTNGAIGCSMSHLKCLENAREKALSHLLICEDDTLFSDPTLFKKQFNNFLTNHKQTSWDMVLLAGNNVQPYTKIDDTCIKVSHCQTTTAYLVNGRYFTTLIENIREGLRKLMNNQNSASLYAIDKYWLSLQKRDRWYLIIPLTVIQKEGYSDIEKKHVNYSNLMTNVNKALLADVDTSKFNMRNIIYK